MHSIPRPRSTCAIFLPILIGTLLQVNISVSSAQEHLFPGNSYFGQFYEEALRRVYHEVFTDEIILRAQITASYGIGNITGLRKDSTGFSLIHLQPGSDIRSGKPYTVPCIDEEGNLRAGTTDSSCVLIDYSAVDTIGVERYERSVDPYLANLLEDLWGEMLIRSTQMQEDRYVFTGGVTYHYSRRGSINGYSINPAPGTFIHKLADITGILRWALISDTEVESDSLMNQVQLKSEDLMAELIQSGESGPVRRYNSRVLNGCISPLSKQFSDEYCWEARLTDNGYPNFIIANRAGESDNRYRFELIHFTSDNQFERIPIIPVATKDFELIGDKIFRFECYLLYPWDLADLTIWTIRGFVQLPSFKNYKFHSEGIEFDPAAVPIRVNELLVRDGRNPTVEIHAEHGYFNVENYMENGEIDGIH